MNIITEDHFEAAFNKLNDISENEVAAFIEVFQEKQPYVMVYLLAVCGDELTEDEREIMFLLGTIIWQSFGEAGIELPTVTETILEQTDENNVQMVEYFETESEDEFTQSIMNIISNHPQGELLEIVVTEIMEDDEIRDDVKGMVFIALKVVIECLVNAVNAQN